jgi:hypothetical protein
MSQTRGQKRWLNPQMREAERAYKKLRYATDNLFREREKERRRLYRLRVKNTLAGVTGKCDLKGAFSDQLLKCQQP